MNTTDFLVVSGSHISNRKGEQVVLRGTGVGGWLNMENFIAGYPSTEEAQREVMLRYTGEENCNLFYKGFLDNFVTEQDIRFIRSLGMNLIRLPINYRHLEDDLNPFNIRADGFFYIDQMVKWCGENDMYVILDLHALPGFQNQAWHSDNPTHKALYWKHRHFRERVVNIWKQIAARYKDCPQVAGYNLINEPSDPGESAINDVYHELVTEIRKTDPHHMLFLEGNCYSRDFHMFREIFPNTVYTNHDYALPGFIDGGPYPGCTQGVYVDKEALRAKFIERSEFMLSRDLPVWVGEFGPVYQGDPAADAMRYQILDDQLSIYDEFNVSWALWTYKDIGLQGICYTSPDSRWNRFIKPFSEKKARLGADQWGSTDQQVRYLIEPIEDFMAKEFPAYNPYPFGQKWQIHRMIRHILFAEALLEDFGALFSSATSEDLRQLTASFCFDNCMKREPLIEILKKYL